jgi:two-component system, sensor histidine kinase and response regulator
MISFEERVSLLEVLFRETGMSLPELAQDPEVFEDLIQDVFEDLQRSKVQLRGQISALQARNRDLEDYVHMVAHDLKEPLAALAISSNLITNILDPGSEKFQAYVQQMGLTAHGMNRIINNLLLFAKVSKAEAPVGPVYMERVVANVQDRLSHLIQEQQACIVIPEMWPLAMGYEPWVEEVWANYLSNALKYGGRPPYLELGASTGSEGVVRFWVRDNGPGIPPAVHSRLFTSFHEIGSLNTPEHGLGLPIVQRIVEKLRGQVGVESQAGMGSLFFFTLPAVQSPHEQEPAASYSNNEREKSYSV